MGAQILLPVRVSSTMGCYRFCLILFIFLAENGCNGAPSTSNSDEQPIREIDYNLQGELVKAHYSLQISEKGDRLIVGEQPTEKLEGYSKDDVAVCEKNVNQFDYKDAYLTKVYNRTSDEYEMTETRTAVVKSISDYFIHIRKEVWSCHPPQGSQGESFLRIVNEIIGHTEIFDIKFYDGMRIVPKHFMGDWTTAKILEIKFFLNNDAGTKLVKYEGKLILKTPTSVNDQNIANSMGKLYQPTVSTSTSKGVRERESFAKEEEQTKKFNVDGNGLSLKIGSLLEKSVGNVNSIYNCYREQGIHPFPVELRPKVNYIVKTTHSEILAAPKRTEFFNLFIPIIEEIWTCKEQNGQNAFIRVVHDLVGREQIKDIKFYTGLIELYKITTARGASVRFRTVEYFSTDTRERLEYGGYVKLVWWKFLSLMPKMENRDMVYVLTENRIFRSLISAEGYDMRFGSMWEEIQGTDQDKVKCDSETKEEYYDQYKTKFRLIVKAGDGSGRINKIEHLPDEVHLNYYRYTRKEVLSCKKDGSENTLFLRVFNEIEVIVPMHEIEYYDGVQIFNHYLKDNKKSVKIREVKYIHPTTGAVLRFDGVIELPEKSTGVMSMDKWNIENIIMKTEEDIFWRLGHFCQRKRAHREIYYGDEFIVSRTFNNDGEILLINSTSEISQTIGSSTDTAQCKFAKYGNNDYKLPALITKNDGRVIDSRRFPNEFAYPYYAMRAIYYVCSLETDKKTKFWRVVLSTLLTIDAAKSVKKITVNEGLKISVVKGSDESGGFFVEVHGIDYVSIPDQKRIKFEGLIEFMMNEASERMSGTTKLISGRTKLSGDLDTISKRYHYVKQELKHELSKELLYRSQLSTVGDTLKLGTRWAKTFGDEIKSIDCSVMDNVNEGQFNTFFRTRVEVVKGMEPERRMSNQQLFEKYFDDIKIEVRECVTQDGSKKVLRILNQFAIKPDRCDKVKDLLQYDGVTVLNGDYSVKTGCSVIVEVKYLDPVYYTVVKYQGRVVLKNADNDKISESVSAIKIKNVAKLDVLYTRKETSEVRKTVIAKEGAVIEIGEKYPKTVWKNRIICREMPNQLTKDRYSHRPKIFINKKDKGGIYRREEMDDHTYPNCFDFNTVIWDCSADGDEKIVLRRVRTELKYRNEDDEHHGGHVTCPIGRIYHYDGIIVQTDPKFRIYETKYLEKNENNEYTSVRFEGLLQFAEAKDQDLWRDESKEVKYGLDTETLNTKVLDTNGFGFVEVGSSPVKIIGSSTESVLCKRDSNQKYNIHLRTIVAATHFELRGGRKNVEWSEDEFPKFFENVKQEVWECTKGRTGIKFFRIVNIFVLLSQTFSRIYYSDGISIGNQVFPDNSKLLQIREVRYVDNLDNLEVVRFDGEITFEASFSSKASRLFHIPKDQDYTIELLHTTDVKAQDIKYWPLEILRIYALKQKPKDTIAPFTYTGIKRRIIDDSVDVEMVVGSKPQITFTPKKELKCLLDIWNPNNKKRFLTQVKLYFDSDEYALNEETILDFFKINKLEVWICANEDETILKIKTELTAVGEFRRVTYMDGVEMLPDVDKNKVHLMETKFLNADGFKVLRCDAAMKTVEPPQDNVRKASKPLESSYRDVPWEDSTDSPVSTGSRFFSSSGWFSQRVGSLLWYCLK